MTCYHCWRDRAEEYDESVRAVGQLQTDAVLDHPGEEPDDDTETYCDWHWEEELRRQDRADRDMREAVRGDLAKAYYYHKKYGDPL